MKDYIMQHKYIWGYLYGHLVGYEDLDVLVRYETEKLIWNKDNTKFYYIWGMPGPDCNLWDVSEYKINWCFYPSEMPNVKVHPDEIKYITE